MHWSISSRSVVAFYNIPKFEGFQVIREYLKNYFHKLTKKGKKEKNDFSSEWTTCFPLVLLFNEARDNDKCKEALYLFND